MTDLAFASLRELRRMLQRKIISSVELTHYFLARLGEHGPRYNALAELTPDVALAQAKQADALLAQGKDTPLLGIPYGAKDLLATKGIPTRWGSPAHKDQVPDHDATTVTRLREAGAPMLGKLAMVEIAGGGGYSLPSASLHGPGLNPWNVNTWAGGSSSGSGSAVAAGLVPFALGSETWGSIVTPSTYCGITGLRPTYGLVSRFGAMELAWTMDKVGPMAHSAEDCGLILQAIAGPDGRDLTTTGQYRFLPRKKTRKTKHPFKIGVLPADFSDEPVLENVFEGALAVLQNAGMHITPAQLPNHDYNAIASTLLYAEMAAAHEAFIRSDKLDLLVNGPQKDGLRSALNFSAAQTVQAQQQKLHATHDLLKLFDEFDALVSPSLMIEAPTLDTDLRTAFKRRGGYSVLGALCGVPALAMPMGFGKSGLPLGITLTGNLFDENTLIGIGMSYQRETDWHKLRPVRF
ncbi:MAG: amidase [Anaerolineae bacterium]|nr:amidase [Anaerolineae bacterium]